MSELETEICQYMLQHGIFDTMIEYKKDYQQLGVILNVCMDNISPTIVKVMRYLSQKQNSIGKEIGIDF